MLSQDNSHLRNQVRNLFDYGHLRYNKGSTVDQKEEGINSILKGLKILQNWIDRENDTVIREQLKKNYNAKYAEVETYLKFLESAKKNQNVENHGDSQMMKRGAGGGNNGDNNEKDKFKDALSEAIVTDKPNIKWSDIAGLVNAKKSLQEAVILPTQFPDIFKGARKPWKGILLYGPPGTGKTFLAKACATEADATFFSISSSDLVSKYVGESEKLIKTLFSLAREKKPSIIFIDEIDSLCGSRTDGENEASRRIKTEFLVQMQGVGHDDTGILVLGATNLPWALDPAIRRRFEKRIYIPLPDIEARNFMIVYSLGNTEHSLQKHEIENIAKRTDGYSGSDISILVRDGIFEPVRKLQNAQYFLETNVNGNLMYSPAEDHQKNMPNAKKMTLIDVKNSQLIVPKVTKADMDIALTKTKPSVDSKQLTEYVQFTENFGQEG